MWRSYRAFGLTLSANHPIPGLVASAHEAGADVLIGLEGHPQREDPAELHELWYEGLPDGDGNLLRVWKVPSPWSAQRDGPQDGDGAFRLVYSDGAQFLIDSSASNIRVTWLDTLTIEDVATYLLGPVLGFVLHLRGTVCLHASAIAVGDRCIAILAPAHHGKSTTAAAFAQFGYPVLTDDIAALDDRGTTFLVQPGYPRLRLWPHSVEGLFGSSGALPRITPGHPSWDKCYLDLVGDKFQFQDESLALTAMYTGERCEEETTPRLEALSGQEALLMLISNTYVRHLTDRWMRAREFDVLGRLARNVPVKRFKMREGHHYLPALCDVLLDDCRGLRRHSAGSKKG